MSREVRDSPRHPEQHPRSERADSDPASFGINAVAVEEIQQRFEVDPGSVHPDWSRHLGRGRAPAAARPAAPAAPPTPGAAAAAPAAATAGGLDVETAEKHARVLRLIHFHRARGHRVARTDPLGNGGLYFPELDPAHYGFGDEDLDLGYIAGDLPGGPVQALRQILERLRATYCGTVGFEFTHIQDPGRKQWLQKRIEEAPGGAPIETPERLRVLRKLAEAESFERFLQARFLGQKRFSLEGAESLIPAMDTIVEDGPRYGLREIVIGMAHRGRLNVLANILDKSLESIFSEFEDIPLLNSPFGSGDVKYHKGFSSDRQTHVGERVHLSLTANPSHLEAVDPVVEGRARAKQVRAGDPRGRSVLPLLIHGDAAFAGQGIVAETLNLSRLAGYSTGGTLHIVVNNQIGFTTTPAEARSTLYCTDVAKMIQVPIFHVNGDDPEAVVRCIKLAMAYRQRFQEDVVIDLVCYRRHGHNEGDEPSFTQPLLYERIRQLDPVRKRYTRHLIEHGLLAESDVARIDEELETGFTHALQSIKTRPPGPDEPYEPRGPWSGYQRTAPAEQASTAVSPELLAEVAEGLSSVPPDFHVHKKLAALLERRRKLVAEGGPVDWALGEALAFGTLLVEGSPVRLSGQDSSRGTFSQRHATLVDVETAREYTPLDHLTRSQARFEVYDSLLSEVAALGFEYGYSLADPTTLVLWEAQFGDFVNGAQVIIDQFIVSAHVKWQRMSGLVMLLPHGYEGQGPEHSSGRIERFLQLCAEDNLQVANCTTPAQYFHLLRRQMQRTYRAPLVIFTPKSLLRAPQATSSTEAFTSGGFSPVLDDEATAAAPENVRRVLVCSGKVYYDLLERRERGAERRAEFAGEVALVRLEQLYPWPAAELQEAVQRYTAADTVFWVQEEPANMGAWTFARERIQDLLRADQKLGYAGRLPSASTAGGSTRLHRERQANLVEASFAGLE